MIEIKRKGNDYGLYASTSFKEGDVVHVLTGYLFKDRLRETIEVEHEKTIVHLWDRLFAFCNHSFNPSVEINKRSHVVTALQDIAEGDEITFNYTTHESKIVAPFMDSETFLEVGDYYGEEKGESNPTQAPPIEGEETEL